MTPDFDFGYRRFESYRPGLIPRGFAMSVRIFSGNSNPELARSLVPMGTDLGRAKANRFFGR